MNGLKIKDVMKFIRVVSMRSNEVTFLNLNNVKSVMIRGHEFFVQDSEDKTHFTISNLPDDHDEENRFYKFLEEEKEVLFNISF